MPTIEELKLLQALPLELKVAKTQARIREFVEHFGEENVSVSFSGGKDSTVLLHLVRQIYPNIKAVFVNTGLEYPEIQSFVKTFDNVTILRPKMRFDEVIKKYGYPFISKDVATRIYEARKGKQGSIYAMQGKNPDGTDSDFKKSMYGTYKPLLDIDFVIGYRCCGIMKEQPLRSLSTKPIIATMADESLRRQHSWVKTGCNAFECKEAKSKPMSFWTEQDVLRYIKENNIKIVSVYGNIEEVAYNDINQLSFCGFGKLQCTGCNRTGCIFCGFGAHLDKRDGVECRFVRLKRTHPKQYDYCMGGGEYNENGIWQPNKDGLGMAHCIDVLNSIYSKKGEPFIEY